MSAASSRGSQGQITVHDKTYAIRVASGALAEVIKSSEATSEQREVASAELQKMIDNSLRAAASSICPRCGLIH